MVSELKRLQFTQIEILNEIDAVCREYKLKYSLYAGTLLGAVRHQGFIPWDDDLDVCMPRADYERFLKVWKQDPHTGFLLMNKKSDPAFCQSFSKIRKEHTTFLEFEKQGDLYHTGIFVDIFPIDRMPEDYLRRALFMWNAMCYQLYTREFVPPKSGTMIRICTKVLMVLIPRNRRSKVRNLLLTKLTRYNNDETLPMVAIETLQSLRQRLPKDLFDSMIELPFEDGYYSAFSNWEAYLTTKYGKYMQLPPEAERVWKHHPLIIDFEHSYDEIKKSNNLRNL